jgi:hypothetical protein
MQDYIYIYIYIYILGLILFDPSFFLSACSSIPTHFLTAHIYITNIITFEPFALNVEFQHFIPKFNKKLLLF